MSEVILKNVCKTYANGFKAVDDFNLEIRDREFIVLVGPSGCGKSTTLRMVAGLETITSGTISIGGKIVNNVSAKDREIAMVFQNYALYPHMTVRENMSFGLKLRHYAKEEIQARVAEAAEMLGIASLLDRRPNQLSGGQRQRVAVGRAIVRRPKVFLFDEPLSNLDAKMRVQMRVEISKLHKKLDSTMIYVTHDQTEAMTMGDRIVVMEGGKMQQCAEPMTVYRKPANRFVAGFIGTPSMNFLKGKIDKTLAGYVFINDAFSVPLPSDWTGRISGLLGADDLTLGIRPEDVSCSRTPPEGLPSFAATLDVVEPMGAETCVYATVNGTSFIARLAGHADFCTDEALKFGLQMSEAHLFTASGESVV